ncbi:MAG: molybdopterin-dependent oxidoreductase [Bernardetiaceae bacterium]|nr:molybdopterin-dependent oxidoreductase [Bernardetiaceae bacterium]
MTNNDDVQKISRRKTLKAFASFFALLGGGAAGLQWLASQPLDGGIRGGIPQPLRQALDQNEKIFRPLYSPEHLVQEYPKSAAAAEPRVNGDVGLDEATFDAATWQLNVLKKNGNQVSFSLADLKKLPKVEVVHNFKCIEGWSQISWWGGARLADFLAHYGLHEEAQMNHLGLMTPDEGYYVGIDMPSALHPQTLLCYELNGQPLPPAHGYPLRLIIPVKYGVKSLKRIGTMYFDNERLPDYWTERGYDYYIGL